MSSPAAAPAWPRIEAVAHADGTGEVIVNGSTQPVAAGNLDEVRIAIIRNITGIARSLGRPVRVSTTGPDGYWPLIVHPDGAVTADDDDQPRPGRRAVVGETGVDQPALTDTPRSAARPETVRAAADEAPLTAPDDHGAWTAPEQPQSGRPSADQPVMQGPIGQGPVGQGPVGRPAAEQRRQQHSVGQTDQPVPQQRRSFLTREQLEEPATQGFRGFLGKVGIPMSPNESERAERADVRAVSQHWPGPRTIAIVNGKGGAGKSPSTVLVSAVFALFGGAGVVAWDNNQTRGTLGWRTEQGPHESTLHDLLPEIPRLLGTGAQSADLAHYVHHQSRDRFDVLRSQPMVLAHLQRLEPEDVDAIHSVLGKYYRLIFIDSGNDESDPMWLRMIDHADQLVVATTTRDDHAEAGALLLEALAERDERSAALARSSVAIVSQADPSARPADLKRVAAGYQALTRATVTIPYDPAMVDGLLRYGSLKPGTKRAWLAAAAAVARGL